MIKNKNILNVKYNNKYITTLTTDKFKVILTKDIGQDLVKVKLRNLKCGMQQKYLDEVDKKIAKRCINKRYYAKKTAKYKRDIDRSISKVSNIKYREELKNFLTRNFEFNFFHTLTYNDTFYLMNKEKIRGINDYNDCVKQDYVSNQKNISLEQLRNYVERFIGTLERNGKKVYSHFFVSYERNSSQMWHAHIAINIVDSSISNVHMYLKNKWKLGISKVIKIKETIKDTETVLAYLSKNLGGYDSEIIQWDFGYEKSYFQKDVA
ncbi:hypothetical protein [Sphingobacterium siyangense]|uniref:hypothetical protein n=1 Tax=Sphingobacterium siyangense TaxID=459529 RepID=UPI003DA4CB39